MPNETTREDGFYWVKLSDGEITIGQWADSSWLVIGSDEAGCNAACEVLSPKLALTDEAAWEIEDLRTSVIAFGAPWAVKYAEEWGLPPKHLDPRHYDTLKRAGARMDDFIRGSARAGRGMD